MRPCEQRKKLKLQKFTTLTDVKRLYNSLNDFQDFRRFTTIHHAFNTSWVFRIVLSAAYNSKVYKGYTI